MGQVESLDGRGHRSGHGEVGNHQSVHELSAGNDNGCVHHHSSHAEVDSCHDILHRGEDYIHGMDHVDHNHHKVGEQQGIWSWHDRVEYLVGSMAVVSKGPSRRSKGVYIGSASDSDALKFATIKLFNRSLQVGSGLELNKASVFVNKRGYFVCKSGKLTLYHRDLDQSRSKQRRGWIDGRSLSNPISRSM